MYRGFNFGFVSSSVAVAVDTSAPVYDAYADGSVNNGSSIPSFNVNIGSGGNAAVIVSVRSEATTATPAADITVTVGGVSATLISGATGSDQGFSTNHLFGVAIGSATGNQAIVVSWTSGNAYNHAVASSFTGVDQTTPFDNGNGRAIGYGATSSTLSITSESGDLTFSDVGEKGSTESVTVNNTQRYSLVGGDGKAVGSTAAGAASVDHIATISTASGRGVHVGCNINAVSGGGGGSSFPSTSLVAFYKLDEASGDALDSSGNSKTFTESGTVASTTGTIGGETVNVRTLDRPAGAYFSRADDADFDVGDGNDFTISFWAAASSSMDNFDTGGIFSKRNNVNASSAGYTIALRSVSSDTRIRYNAVCDGTTTVGDSNASTGIAIGAWAHYMMVFTADNTLVTYVNNVQYSSEIVSSVTGSLANSINSYIGQLAYNSQGSIIADVTHLGFWEKALDSSERTALYNGGKVLAPSSGGGTNGLSTGLIRAYLAEDLTDELGNANLTVRGSGISSTTGKNNNCYTYSTSGGHVSDWFPDSNNWTISCWINADAIDSATFNGTIGCHDANNHRAYFGLGNSNEAVVAVGNTHDVDSSVTYSAGTWYNFITIWDGTNAWCFINGELRIKFAATFSGTSTDALHLGERIYNGSSYNQYDGKQDETYIWNRALDVGSATSVGDTGGGDIANLQTLFYASFNGFTDYRSTVLADNPLFYYRLGEASGSTTAYDEVASASNGAYVNTPDLGETGAISGDSNTSVKFNEASSQKATTVTLSETSLLPCTIECFVKLDGASDNNAGIVFYRATNAQASGLNMRGSSTGVKKLGYHWNNSSATYGFSGGPTLADDKWYYVALVVEATQATIYAIEENGTLTSGVKTTTHTALDASGDEWMIAQDDATARYFNGNIDEVAIYDQALSQTTIEAHAAAAGFAPSPDILHWPLNDSAGTTISANVGPGSTANTGTLNGDYLYMDSGDAAFESSSTLTYGTNIVSVSFWWQTDNTGNYGSVFRSEIYTNTNMFEFYNGGGWKTLYVKGDSGILEERVYDLLTANTWYHFVCVFDGSTATGAAKFYINKVAQTLSNNSDTKTGTSNFSDAEFCIKGPYGTTGDFLMDDLRIYSGELTTSQIDAIYDAGRPS